MVPGRQLCDPVRRVLLHLQPIQRHLDCHQAVPQLAHPQAGLLLQAEGQARPKTNEVISSMNQSNGLKSQWFIHFINRPTAQSPTGVVNTINQ